MNETSVSREIKIREKILSAIISYIEQHGYPPTVREISDMVGLKSTSSTQSHLIRMKADGMIETDAPEFSTRAIRVPGYVFTKTIQHEDDWIPCDEEMPENMVEVLVTFEYFRYGHYNRLYRTIGISYTCDGKWSGFVNGSSGWRDLTIFAWKPLPKPYKEEP